MEEEKKNQNQQKNEIKFEDHSVNGLIETLKDYKCLEGTELEEAQEMLTTLTENMTSDETKEFIHNLEMQINSPTSNILVDGKIDITAFSDKVQTISQKINEEKTIRINEKKAKSDAENAMQEQFNSENQDQDKSKVEMEVDKCIDTLDGILKGWEDVKKLNITEDETQRLTNLITKAIIYRNDYLRLIKDGFSEEDAQKIAATRCDLSEDEFNSHMFQNAIITIMKTDLTELLEKGDVSSDKVFEATKAKNGILLKHANANTLDAFEKTEEGFKKAILERTQQATQQRQGKQDDTQQATQQRQGKQEDTQQETEGINDNGKKSSQDEIRTLSQNLSISDVEILNNVMKSKLQPAFVTNFDLERKEQQLSAKTSEITGIEDGGVTFNLKHLKKCVSQREIAASEYTRLLRVNQPQEIRKAFSKEFYELTKKLTLEYLATGKTVSDIYEEVKNQNVMKLYSFEDVLDGIVNNVEEYFSNNLSTGTNNKVTLINREREYRRLAITIDSHNRTMKNIEETNNEEDVKAIKRDFNARNPNSVKEMKDKMEEIVKLNGQFKKSIIRSLKIDPDALREAKEESDRYDAEHGTDYQYIERKSYISLKDAIKKRNRIQDNRKKIREIIAEKKTTVSDAIKTFFEENPEELNQYSEEEKKVLLGKNKNKNKKQIKSSFKYLKEIQKNRNDNAITATKDQIRLLDAEIEAAKKLSDPTKLIQKLKEKEAKEESLSALKRSNVKLGVAGKSADEIIYEKEKEAALETMVKSYIETGMIASESFDLQQKNNPRMAGISFYDFLNKLKETGTRYIPEVELTALINNEKRIRMNYIEIEALGSYNPNDERIKKLKGEIEEYKNERNNVRIRDTLKRKSGFKSIRNVLANHSKEKRKKERSEENNQENVVEGQNVPVNEQEINKKTDNSTIEETSQSSTLKPDDIIVDNEEKGLVVNYRAVIDKFLTTPRKMQQSLKKIVDLGKDFLKGKQSNKHQEEQNINLQDVQEQDQEQEQDQDQEKDDEEITQ